MQPHSWLSEYDHVTADMIAWLIDMNDYFSFSPGTNEQDVKTNRKVQYHHCHQSCIKQHSTIDSNTDKVSKPIVFYSAIITIHLYDIYYWWLLQVKLE